jgi:hypothetical protein
MNELRAVAAWLCLSFTALGISASFDTPLSASPRAEAVGAAEGHTPASEVVDEVPSQPSKHHPVAIRSVQSGQLAAVSDAPLSWESFEWVGLP